MKRRAAHSLHAVFTASFTCSVTTPYTDENGKQLKLMMLSTSGVAENISPYEGAQASREDKAWNKYAVLSFDGGGVRGYASLLLLRELMRAIEKCETKYTEHGESSFLPTYIPKQPPNNQKNPGDQTHSTGSIEPKQSWRQVSSLGQKPRRQKSASQPAELREPNGFLPCHYFDYIFGTSTGGLNAIMLGRLRMSVDDCIDRYPELVKKIFGKPRGRFMGLRDKYNPKNLEKAIRNLVAQKSPASQGRQIDRKFANYPAPSDVCKTVVIAKEISANGQVEHQYRFRTYENGSRRGFRCNYGPADDDPIWMVARATSAAPGYFKEMKIDNRKYSDGGAGFNNPAKEAIHEVRTMAGDGEGFPIALLVSIGTGMKSANESPPQDEGSISNNKREKTKARIKAISQAPVKPFKKPIGKAKQRLNRMKHEITNAERIHEELDEEMRRDGHSYSRLNADATVGALQLDEWRGDTKSIIEDRINADLRDPHSETLQTIKDCADRLVKLRRARIAEDPWMWTRFASCKMIRCRECEAPSTTSKSMKSHMKQKHQRLVRGKEKDEIFNLIDQICDFEDPIVPGGPF